VIAKRRQGENGRQVVGFRLWGSLTGQGSAWLNPQFALFKNNRRRLDRPISRVWPDSALAILAAIGPVKLPILADASTGAAEHLPAVGADVGGARVARLADAPPPKPTRLAHGLHPAIDSAKPLPKWLFTAICRKHYRINPSGVTIVIPQGVPNQPVQLIV
jgi:hypothetical protein